MFSKDIITQIFLKCKNFFHQTFLAFVFGGCAFIVQKIFQKINRLDFQKIFWYNICRLGKQKETSM
nr:MAG TPA: hypothetical protein [Caudoviricetes sp.]